MGLRWYVVRTEPQSELVAADVLERVGHEIFLPLMPAPNSRGANADIPVFPGYLFLRFDPESNGWPIFRSSYRVRGWVSFGGQVPCLPDKMMNELIDRWELVSKCSGFVRRFLPGEKVHVVSGNLDSLAEIVEEAKTPQARAKVLLHFMGGLIPAQVPYHSLKPIDVNQEGIAWRKTSSRRGTRGKGRRIQGFGLQARAAT